MPLSEFELIRRYFTPASLRGDVILGVGDDAALCRVPPGMELAVAVDTMVEGVHFPVNTAPQALGHKILAVNLSDMAAMGAEPAWFTLSLTCPQADAEWLDAFSQGLLALAGQHRVALIGGDTTRGPLAVSVQILGLVPASQAIRRAGAQPGDGIYVTGTPGDAGLGLQSALGQIHLPPAARQYAENRLHRPTPRVAEGVALRGVASAAVDISDGLLADLGHILEHGENLGAVIDVDRLPLSAALRENLSLEHAWALALGAGDDYELCATVPSDREAALDQQIFRRIGVITDVPGIRCLRGSQVFVPPRRGYEHYQP